MTPTLKQDYLDARQLGGDPLLTLWMRRLGEPELRAMRLLSVVLSATAAELDITYRQVWPDSRPPRWLQLTEWPYVVQEASGLMLRDIDVVRQVRQGFQDDDHDAYLAAHRAFAAVEERRAAAEQDDDGSDGDWFARGRLAYYLAAGDPDRSLSTFDNAFSHPPVMDRTGARMWLTSLVLRQSDLLADHSRHLAFYRGFRAYVTEHRQAAAEAFEEVVRQPDDDAITAIAEHLLGVLLKSEELERADRLLADSVDRSRRIGLKLNEIMAANSRVWVLLRRSRSAERSVALLATAEKIAETNLDTAVRFGQTALVLRCAVTSIVARWTKLTGGGARVGTQASRDADNLVRRLSEVRLHAMQHGDAETAASAVNQAALILRDTDRSDEAVSHLELLTGRELIKVPRRHLSALAKTARSISRRPSVAPPTAIQAASIAKLFDAERQRSRPRPSDLEAQGSIETDDPAVPA